MIYNFTILLRSYGQFVLFCIAADCLTCGTPESVSKEIFILFAKITFSHDSDVVSLNSEEVSIISLVRRSVGS